MRRHFAMSTMPEGTMNGLRRIVYAGLCVVALSTAARGDSAQCFDDTQGCMTACVGGGQGNASECMSSCGHFDNTNNGYCYVLAGPQPLSAEARKEIFDRERSRCQRAECDPTYNQQMAACTQGKITAKDKDRVVACTMEALKADAACRKSCSARAMQAASGQ
jgi:hypothetical protein